MSRPLSSDEVREKYRQRRRRYRVLLAVTVALLAIELYEFTVYPPGSVGEAGAMRVGVVALAALLGVCAYAFAIWRCPSCHGFLNAPNPRYCPRCGVQLRD